MAERALLKWQNVFIDWTLKRTVSTFFVFCSPFTIIAIPLNDEGVMRAVVHLNSCYVVGLL